MTFIFSLFKKAFKDHMVWTALRNGVNMGNKISIDNIEQINNSSLIIYCGRTGIKEKAAVPIEIQLAEELSRFPERNRTLRMDFVMSKIIKLYHSDSPNVRSGSP